ncbi:Signal transduction histidine kinase [Polaribacter sp. KT25b]|uniref:hybrid sensor histidine kinase/response regulator transcription factor n=1 Tax=Polaribacter sp. KT25b TaxID=1855336 RepID=UPI000879393A|nr:hybrid sensor histidine kinase/response regulator transcription factor [Polaribacter sp. KT25b]SDS58458.1 Signal transduction histidine kinase [Polaribacter sp. KT25b]
MNNNLINTASLIYKDKIQILKKITLFVLIFFSSSSFSQKNETFFNDLIIQGDPFNKKVNVLFEDSIGYLWIGSNTGLYRYDGYNLVSYQQDVFDPHSIPNNSINSIIEDKNKNLWIGSESFLIHFNRKENKFKGFNKNTTTEVLYSDSKGNIFIDLKGSGFAKIDTTKNFNKISDKKKITINLKKPILKGQINSFTEDDFGRNWIGTSKGLYILNNDNSFIKSNFNNDIINFKNFGNNRFIAISSNSLFILNYNKANANLEILESYPNITNTLDTQATLTSLAKNLNNEDLWIGTTNGLFKAIRKNNCYTFVKFSKEPENGNLKSNYVSSIVFDTYGNLWIGTLKGINKYRIRTSIFEYNEIIAPNKIENDIANSMVFFSPSNILIGMNSGLYTHNPKTNISTKIHANIRNIKHVSLNYEKDKLLLASGNKLYESELFDFKKNSFKLSKIKTFNYEITDITVINKNEIWVGLWNGGVDIINTKNEISKFKKDIIQKLSKSHTSVFLLTEDQKLWIGTRGEGLFKVDLNNETIEDFIPSKENGLTSNAILSLHEDNNKNVWIGTRSGGLNKYIKETNSFKSFRKLNGPSSNTVSSIKSDHKGNIWLSTQDGLARFDIEDEKIIPFKEEDGIKESQFLFNSSTSNKSKNTLYFGCSDGFYTVHCDNFSQKSILPSTVITSFATLGATENDETDSELNATNLINVNSEKPIVLPYNQNNIVVNFSSLDLTTPNKNEFAYMLEGLNNYWIYTNASNRNANYNDLSSGKYTFKVKSSNSDGVWNEIPTELSFKIMPSIWKSNLAILAYIIIALILLFISTILIRRWYRLKQNLVKETISREKDNELNQMKMTFFTDISHELRTPLSLILGTIEKVVKEKKFTLSPLTSQRIYNNTLRMHRLINQIMDIRKFDQGKFKLNISKNDIIKDISIIKNAFNDFARIYGITYELTSNEEVIKAWYDVDILEKILFNLLSNAFKYTQEGGEINIITNLVKEDAQELTDLNLPKSKYIKCIVKDNGVGIPPKDLEHIFDRYYQATKPYSNQIPGTGIGMELVQKLLERHHGLILAESEENKFTEFTFYLPISKKMYNKNEILKTSTPLLKNFIKNSEFQIIEEVSTEFDEKVSSTENTKPKVLIVDDNSELRLMIKEELIDLFNILEASDGKEGYDIMVREKPKLVISDIMMPIEDGISMLKRMKRNSKIKNIPIFMLTAKNSQETRIECLALGADDYIEKPFSMEFVKWKVKNTLVSRKQLRNEYSKVITAAPSEIEIESNDEKFIKKLVSIVESSMSDHLFSVEYLASEVGMSRANLYRKLKVIVNETPVNFIKKIRLKRAEQLLKKNSMYISEVAYLTGFNNQKYFSKCFNKEYGISPTEYTKQHKDSIENSNNSYMDDK